MNEILALLKETAPGVIFYAILALSVGWYLKHLSTQIISNFKNALDETRTSYQAIIEQLRVEKEEVKKDIVYYSEQLKSIKEENSKFRDQVKELRKELERTDREIFEIQKALGDGFVMFGEGLGAIDQRTQALFVDRDKISEDLKLVWKVLINKFEIEHSSAPMTNLDDLKSKPKDSFQNQVFNQKLR